MKRNTNVGGRSTVKKRKARNPGSEARALAMDPDAVDPSTIDLATLESLELEMSPALRARIRARRALRQLTIRLSTAQIEATRELAKKRGEPYQRLLRQWISEGLRRARQRRHSRTG
jgi:predicted DNA binding CopG/RHH family protein